MALQQDDLEPNGIDATVIADDHTDTISVRRGESLLAALQRAGWHVPAPCGGAGKCGKCLVVVDPIEAAGDRHEEEERFTGSDPSRRLACRTYPTGDLTVTISGHAAPPASTGTHAKGGAIDVPTSGRPVVIRERLSIEEPTLDDQRSILRRIRDAAGLPTLRMDRALLAGLTPAPAQVDATIDAIAGFVIDVHEATGDDNDEPLLALAFDIGTTTVAGYLVDLATHSVVASRSEANAQGTYGADVISRITAFGEDAPLHSAICDQLARMTRDLASHAGARTSSITTAAIVGNTTMIHLLLDLDPTAMARSPFTPVVTEAVALPAADLRLPLHDRALVRLLPGVSAYVGTDIVADLLSSRMHDESTPALLVDIGTNGEIVCGGRDGLIACSTAAGPAFEGATIRHGSGGVAGAINHVRREGTELVIETIQGAAPRSICGTGLMDTVAMLLTDGIVDASGRMDGEGASAQARACYERRFVEIDGEPAVVLADGAASGGEPIVITQGDIRQVQLAKGAIAAGIQVLLQEAGVAADELSAVYFAGGFGSYVRPDAAVRVGLLPGVPADRVVALGNAAGAGAARVLLDDESAAEAERIVEACRYVELSGSAAFQGFYMEEMLFPPE